MDVIITKQRRRRLRLRHIKEHDVVYFYFYSGIYLSRREICRDVHNDFVWILKEF